MELFDHMPLAVNVNGTYISLHGGISASLIQLESINDIARVEEPRLDSPLFDILWADPLDEAKAVEQDYVTNENRGGKSVRFGTQPLKEFLAKNQVEALVRAHEVKQNGYQFHFLSDETLQPQCITVFSAPNYCGFYGNMGAVFCSKADKSTHIETFSEVRNQPEVSQLASTNANGCGIVIERIDLINYQMSFLVE